MADSAQRLATVRQTAIDGRLANVFWRLGQLRNLHTVLVEKEDEVVNAITKDSRNTGAEARIEYYLTLASVKHHFSSLDPAKILEDEYRVANGKDAPDRNEPVGIVYIEPTAHTLFYSSIASLAAAIAAGNCVVVRIDNTLRDVPSLLRKLLEASLDPDVFAISSQLPGSDILDQSVQVLQNGSAEPATNLRIVSPAQARVIALVDRTANLEEAAKAVVAARFSFSGRSPYAPDLVLVNEFVKTQFLNAVVQQTIRFMTEQNGVPGEKSGTIGRPQSAKGLTDEWRSEAGVRIVTSGSNGSIVEIERRDPKLLSKKIAERSLAVHAITSLDDGIDLATSGDPLLATYLFAAPASAKYLGQFIKAQAVFANHIPLELLVGPAAPAEHPLDPSNRFPTTLFTVPRPQYVHATPLSQRLGGILQAAQTEQLRQLKTESTAALPADRPYKKGIGFFEQGILTGLSITGVSLLTTVGALTYYGSRALLARWR